MKIISANDYDDLSAQAAGIIEEQIVLKPDSVLGLATGASPLGTYRELIRRFENGGIDFERIRTVNLDEYEGLSEENPRSYSFFMRKNLFDHINIKPENTYIPNGTAPDAGTECKRYDRLISGLGGIDLQLLGIGPNGHIGFNEPGEYLIPGTHRVALAEATIAANKRFFEKEEDVPRFAYTMGIRDIMQAKKIVMIVSGTEKAEIVKRAFFGPVTTRVPASILQLHGDFILIADKEALSECPIS